MSHIMYILQQGYDDYTENWMSMTTKRIFFGNSYVLYVDQSDPM